MDFSARSHGRARENEGNARETEERAAAFLSKYHFSLPVCIVRNLLYFLRTYKNIERNIT